MSWTQGTGGELGAEAYGRYTLPHCRDSRQYHGTMKVQSGASDTRMKTHLR
ncbi:Uncharacterized protein DAT39_000229, partial [Clarias magur]